MVREPRYRPLLLVSYRSARIREFPPSRLAGALTHAVSGDQDPQWQQTIDSPQLRGRVDTTVFGPVQCLGLAAFALSSQSLLVYEIQHPRPKGYCGCIPWKTPRTSIYLLSGSPSVTLPPRPPAWWLHRYAMSGARLRWDSPAFAATWRSAARASGYLHTLTSLPHRYGEGALSGNVGYTDSISCLLYTSPSPRD